MCWSPARSSPTGWARPNTPGRQPDWLLAWGRRAWSRRPSLRPRSASAPINERFALDLVHPTPDAVRFADPERVVETRTPDRARATDRLRLALAVDPILFVLDSCWGEKDLGLRSATRSL